MRERFIIAPGINGTELLRSLAAYGVNTIGMRVMNAAEAAMTALIRNGYTVDRELISDDEIKLFLQGMLAHIPYFTGTAGEDSDKVSAADAENVKAALELMRSFITEDEHESLKHALKDGEFPDKNEALLKAYEYYTDYLNKQKVTDKIGIVRSAVDKALTFDADFLVLKEFPLTALEERLVEILSNRNYRVLSISELFCSASVAGNKGTSEDKASCVTEKANNEDAVDKTSEFKACNNTDMSAKSDDTIRDENESVSAEYTKKFAGIVCKTFSAYGAANEADRILGYIYKHHIPLDKCLIVSPDSGGYAQIFYRAAGAHGIPITFGNGISIRNTAAGKLLSLLLNWNTIGHNGIDAYKALFKSEAFDRQKLIRLTGLTALRAADRLSELMGSLRISPDAVSNKARIAAYRESLAAKQGRKLSDKDSKHLNDDLSLLDAAEQLGNDLSLGVGAFIDKYALIRKGAGAAYERSAIADIKAFSDFCISAAGGDSDYEYIPELLKRRVGRQMRKPGALHFTDIKSAFAAIRPYIFVAGLSADNFPGTPTENYLLLDNDIKAFPNSSELPYSEQQITDRKESLIALLSFAEKLGCEITLSYPDYDIAELKELNPSSVLLDLGLDMGKAKAADYADFFNNELSVSRYAAGEYCENPGAVALMQGTDVSSAAEDDPVNVSGPKDSKTKPNNEAGAKADESKPDTFAVKSEGREVLTEQEGKSVINEVSADDASGNESLSTEKSVLRMSPSALEQYFECPYRFRLKYIDGIPDEEEDDPFTAIDAKGIGTLAHSMMERIYEFDTAEGFLEGCDRAVDEYFIKRPPMIHSDADKARCQFKDMMRLAYDTDPHNEIISAEREYEYAFSEGLVLHGYPDRIERTADGRCIIVDFKTGRRIVHTENDLDSCLQTLIYAWLAEKTGLKIDGCEYRYLRAGRTISCRYDEAMEQALSDKLKSFEEAAAAGCYEPNPGKGDENCRFCTMKDICVYQVKMKAEAKAANADE